MYIHKTAKHKFIQTLIRKNFVMFCQQFLGDSLFLIIIHILSLDFYLFKSNGVQYRRHNNKLYHCVAISIYIYNLSGIEFYSKCFFFFSKVILLYCNFFKNLETECLNVNHSSELYDVANDWIYYDYHCYNNIISCLQIYLIIQFYFVAIYLR